jgi:chemotaxis protein histidine kinase CheA
MAGIVTEYFTLFFDASKKERVVQKVNPLARLEVSFVDPAGGYTTRTLSFAFKRIMRDDQIWRIFFAVEDITANVAMETQIREAETTKQRQFEFLLGILHVEPRELDDFIAAAREQLTTMSGALRMRQFAGATASQTAMYKQRLETVFRSVHTVKGHAQLLKFNHFVEFAHEFEDKITALRNKGSVSGEDFLGIAMTQAQLQQGIDDLVQIRSQFLALSSAVAAGKTGGSAMAAKPAPAPEPHANGVANSAPPPPPPPAPAPAAAPAGDDVLAGLGALAVKTAVMQRKRVKFEAAGFERVHFSDTARRSMRDVLVQFVRNSVTHGVELPDQRAKLGKPAGATIRVEATVDEPADRLTVTFRDDGAGLDTAKICAAAIAKGVVTEAEAAALSPGATIGLIFRPGFSTAETVTEDAGRGFGMDIVKDIVVDKLGGKLNMRTEPQKFTEFIVSLPLRAVSAESTACDVNEVSVTA